MISPANNVIIGKLPDNAVIVMKQTENEGAKEEVVSKLQQRDNDVRAHEASHIRNPELITIGGPRYSYVIGPDGKAYAVGGKVSVSTGVAKNPEDAIRKAIALQNASLGVDDPSPHDIGSAMSAQAMLQEALISRASNSNKVFNNINVVDFYKDQHSMIDKYNVTNNFLVDMYA